MQTQSVIKRNLIQQIVENLRGSIRQLLANPVIGRELKIRVRLTRSYWLQGIFLLFLLGLVLLAYTTTVGNQVSMNPFEAQRYLQEFYRIILLTLISLIALIAPALTAASITSERERKTIDLLLTTPLQARDLLAGKLIGSVAFILLLLALSLPASAVCVLLGGATFGELLKTYWLVAMSGMLISAVALSCSTFNSQSGRAVFVAYLSVALLLMFSAPFIGIAVGFRGAGNECYMPLAAINPYAAPWIADTVVPMFGYQIPTWIIGTLIILALTRLMLTSCGKQVGLYDVDPLPSLRRQGIFLSALLVFSTLAAVPFGAANRDTMMTGGVITAILLASLIGLTIPWVSTWGMRNSKMELPDGWYKPLRAFRASPAGALPFLHFWFLLLCAAGLAAYYAKFSSLPDLDIVGFCALVGLNFVTFFWAIGRFGSILGRQIILSRMLAIGFAMIIVLLPVMISMQIYDSNQLADSPLFNIWVFFPFYWATEMVWRGNLNENNLLFNQIIIAGGSLILVILSMLLERDLLKPFRKKAGN
ncbi:MAG: ABC transporter permease subunit [Fimbriimonadia bacterium]|nr:ABC transporter permease subunit [Fimbriimonadia bacterium]